MAETIEMSKRRALAPVIPSTSPNAPPIWSMSPATRPPDTVAVRAAAAF